MPRNNILETKTKISDLSLSLSLSLSHLCLSVCLSLSRNVHFCLDFCGSIWNTRTIYTVKQILKTSQRDSYESVSVVVRTFGRWYFTCGSCPSLIIYVCGLSIYIYISYHSPSHACFQKKGLKRYDYYCFTFVT
ncbi:hypothetical protein I3842_10G064400 [Carya illinoinensis]|uniref:Uncharacterized protein n=1 Tax=Carya illinoinensis TaxID=32201 RepID=A0A922DX07_CARIL|nr:hypothetical protein I3842_10G064400 [Carya illinoinensis]